MHFLVDMLHCSFAMGGFDVFMSYGIVTRFVGELFHGRYIADVVGEDTIPVTQKLKQKLSPATNKLYVILANSILGIRSRSFAPAIVLFLNVFDTKDSRLPMNDLGHALS